MHSQNRFKSLARQDRPSLARSLVASTFFSEPLHTVASRSDYDLQRLARSFAIHIGGIGQEALDEWKKEESQVTRWWLSKLAGVRFSHSGRDELIFFGYLPATGELHLCFIAESTEATTQVIGVFKAMANIGRRCEVLTMVF